MPENLIVESQNVQIPRAESPRLVFLASIPYLKLPNPTFL